MDAIDAFLGFIQNLRMYGLEHYDRWYGLYRGVCEDNEDPDMKGRIIVSCPAVAGDELLADWAWPVALGAGAQAGIFHVPAEGDPVMIAFENGDSRFPMYVGGWWGKPDGVLDTPSSCQKNPPTTRAWTTPNGHAIEFSDDPGKESVTIKWHQSKDNSPDGEDRYSFISVDKDGSVQVQDHTGTSILLNAADGKEGVTIRDSNGNIVSTDKDGIKLVQKDGVYVEAKKDLIQLAGKSVTVAAEAFGVTGGSTLGDGGTEPFVLGNKLLELWGKAVTIFATHTHPTSSPGAPTGPPAGAWPAYTPDVNSTTNKGK